MKVRNVLAVAGLTVALASFAPPVFAQVGTAAPSAGVLSGMPGVGLNGTTAGIFQGAPSAGQPGTQAPASAAPIGTATSDWMSSEGRAAAENSAIFPGPEATRDEKQLRLDENALEREIVAYRVRGYNIGPAAWQKWLGSEALARGDQADSARHFQLAATELRRAGYPSEASRSNDPPETSRYSRAEQSDATLHGNQTSQETNGTNLHSNRSSRTAY